jgi:S-(hydroxymethyl)glutathione dehydrogenase/alcohol dehydrogenase
MRAAVQTAPSIPLVIEEVDIDAPRRGEVRVRLAASGVCRSDYHAFCGDWTVPAPLVLGHEGAGIVEEIGPEVTTVRPGDHVIVSWAPSCGRCFYCVQGRPVLCELMARTAASHLMLDGTSRLRLRGQTAYAFAAVGSFAEVAVVSESATIRIPEEMPLDKAALIGCAVPTGIGAVIHAARAETGSSIAIIGCGGVGLSAVMGGVLSSCDPLIAIDVQDSKLDEARKLGATHTINSSGAKREDVIAAVRELTSGRGPDSCIECIGLVPTIELAIECVRPGGTAVVAGLVPEGHRISLDPYVLADREKVLRGTSYGSVRPSLNFPRLVSWYLHGKLPLDRLVSRTIPLEGVNDAFAAMLRGDVIRSVIQY